MTYFKSFLTAVGIAVIVAGTSSAQDCYPSPSGFGYPGGCDGCGAGCGGRLHDAKAKINGYIDMAENAYHRNNAWPKPFACHDRQLYHGVWNTMYARGLENQCTLCDSHFDSETNELNASGKHKVAGIMTNFPASMRNIYIYEGDDPSLAQTRLANVQQQVGEWFGHLGESVIATTPRPAYGQSGALAGRISAGVLEAQAAPVIQAGGGGIGTN